MVARAQSDDLAATANRGRMARQAGEAFLFAGVISLSALAVVALAIAAPFVLAASALSALFAPESRSGGWRQAGA